MEFSKISSMRSEALCLGFPEPTVWLSAESTAHALRNQLSDQILVKDKGKSRISKFTFASHLGSHTCGEILPEKYFKK